MIEGLFKKLFGKEKSKEAAKKRLKLALIYEDVISKYFIVDKAAIKLDIKRSDNFSSLTLNTPILSARRSQSA